MKLTNENISKIESRLGDLKDLVKKKPWFEAAHILLARKAIVEKSTQAKDILFEASLHAGDRRILKQLIDLPKEAKPKKKPQVETKKKEPILQSNFCNPGHGLLICFYMQASTISSTTCYFSILSPTY